MRRALSLVSALMCSSLWAEAQPPPTLSAEVQQVLPGASADVQNGADFAFLADFIYWNKSPGVIYITDGVGQRPGEADFAVEKSGSYYVPEPGYSPGLRAGMGLVFEHDGWDVLLTYTWLYTKASHHFHENPDRGQATRENWAIGRESPLEVFEASSSMSQTFNFWDLNCGRSFFLSRFFSMRPAFGLVGYYIPSQYTTTYLYEENQSPFPTIHAKTRAQTRSWAIGLNFGLNINLYFFKHWSVDGRIDLSGASEHHIMSSKVRLLNEESGVAVTNQRGKKTKDDVGVYHRIFLGLSWDKLYKNGDYQIRFFAGWNIWSGLSIYYLKSHNLPQSDSTQFQGWTFGGKFDF